MTGSASPVFTIGHSTRTLDAFLELLRRERIGHLVDVRRYPASRRYPHFDTAALARELNAAGIDYSHSPGLGGRRSTHPMSPNVGWRNSSFRGYADHMATTEFQSALDDLIAIGQRIATTMMCAEAVPWRCHRTLIADALVARGIEVRHILDAATNSHVLTRFGRVRNGLVEYPGEEGDDLFSASRSD
jgi:uncharacterized protein (DUF488 family)